MDLTNAVESELTVLATMIVNKDSLAQGVAALRREMFCAPQHAAVFGGLECMFAEAERVDLVTLAGRLQRDGKLDQVGGLEKLAAMLDYATCSGSGALEAHAAKVAEAWTRRQAIALARGLEGSVKAGAPLCDCLGGTAASLADLMGGADSRVLSIADVPLDNRVMLTTGMHDFDRLTGGIALNELTIIAARPSVGKSALALNIARSVSERCRVLFASCEMGSTALKWRMVSSEAHIDGMRLRRGELDEDENRRVAEAVEKLATLRMSFDDLPKLAVLNARVRALGVTMLVVDYLQLMEPPRRYDNRVAEVTMIAQALKRMATEHGIAVIACAQLNRAAESRRDRKPRLSDLRESGAIEQEADLVVLIDRDPSSKLREDRQRATMHVAKNREGATGAVDMVFLEQFTMFVDAAHADASEW